MIVRMRGRGMRGEGGGRERGLGTRDGSSSWIPRSLQRGLCIVGVFGVLVGRVLGIYHETLLCSVDAYQHALASVTKGVCWVRGALISTQQRIMRLRYSRPCGGRGSHLLQTESARDVKCKWYPIFAPILKSTIDCDDAPDNAIQIT